MILSQEVLFLFLQQVQTVGAECTPKAEVRDSEWGREHGWLWRAENSAADQIQSNSKDGIPPQHINCHPTNCSLS